MKLYSLLIFDSTCKLAYSNHKLDEFGFFLQYSIKNGIESFAQESIQKFKVNNSNNDTTNQGRYKADCKIEEHEFTIYGSNIDGFCIVITNSEYPQTTASQLLIEMNKNFNFNAISKIDNQKLDSMFIQYQEPIKVDKVLKLKNTLDETKEVLYDSVDKLFERNDELNDLLKKSEMLAETGVDFNRGAKRLNSCCNLF